MTEVSSATYDVDGNLTQSTEYVDSNQDDNRVTTYQYNWRDQLEYKILPADVNGKFTYTAYTYDNLGDVIETQTYLLRSGASQPLPASDQLLTQSETNYDSLGRVYQTITDNVVGGSVVAGGSLVTNFWYDADGNVIKSQAGGTQEFTKNTYDSLGRLTDTYTDYDPSDSTYTDATNEDGDFIIEQTDYSFDAVGNTILTVARQRYNDNATSTGALDDSDSRASYVATWYDGLGREIATANYGTQASPPTVPATPPSSCATILVSSTAYGYNVASGTDSDLDEPITYNEQQVTTTDPAGIATVTKYDGLGRVVETIQNYVVGGTATDRNLTTDTIYQVGGGDIPLEIIVAVTSNNRSGPPTTQNTTSIYGTNVTDANNDGILSSTPLVYRNDLVCAVTYPDSDNQFVPNPRIPPLL